jgi:hypothetical protein
MFLGDYSDMISKVVGVVLFAVVIDGFLGTEFVCARVSNEEEV